MYDKQQDNGDFKENCRFNFKNEEVNFKDDDYNCTNDEAYYFKLENVPSASKVSFFDSSSCEQGEAGFDFTVKTIRPPTTMQKPFGIVQALGLEPGYILDPGGVWLERVRGDSNQGDGQLSCVKMELSPTP